MIQIKTGGSFKRKYISNNIHRKQFNKRKTKIIRLGENVRGLQKTHIKYKEPKRLQVKGSKKTYHVDLN